jgi:hypothetical protein
MTDHPFMARLGGAAGPMCSGVPATVAGADAEMIATPSAID